MEAGFCLASLFEKIKTMKTLSNILTALLLIGLSNISQAQIVPEQPPINVHVGGTGASKAALNRLGLSKDKIKTLNNLKGPSEGGGRSRHDVQTYKVIEKDLPGVEDYYLRSSYVVLQPGGSSPIHSHARRPAFLQIISGTVFQHRSDGSSFVMGPGDFTFSSDEITHWWINESTDEPMKLWVVELCTEKHHCDEVINGGATVIENSESLKKEKDTSRVLENKMIMKIDLQSEFSDAIKTEKRTLQLRRYEISPGASGTLFDNRMLPSYYRVYQGALTYHGGSTDKAFEEGSIIYIGEQNRSKWSNKGGMKAVVYAVELAG